MNNYSGLVPRADGEFVQLLMHNKVVNKEGFHVCAQEFQRDVACCRHSTARISRQLFFSKTSEDSFSFQILDVDMWADVTYGFT